MIYKRCYYDKYHYLKKASYLRNSTIGIIVIGTDSNFLGNTNKYGHFKRFNTLTLLTIVKTI